MNLSDLRNSIDEIDNQLSALLSKRFRIIKQIGIVKQEQNLPTRDKSREKAIIDRVTKGFKGEEADYIEEVFCTLFNLGVNLEKHFSISAPAEGKGFRRCLVGKSISHSFSARVHALLGRGDYELCDAENEQSFLSVLLSRSFLGLNITMPYKETVLCHLDKIDPLAKECGAVNTVLRSEEGLVGYNTDFEGLRMLFERIGGVSDKRVMLLGNGGAAHTAIAVLKKMGAKEIISVYRSGELNFTNYLSKDADVVVNATPVGMYPSETLSPISVFPKSAKYAIDLVYNPLRTKFMLLAEKQGLRGENGLLMLVKQAAESNRIWFGDNIDDDEVKKVCAKLLLENCGIVLTGMPSAGKTTLGRLLAERTGKKFIDTDEMFAARHRLTPATYIAKYGEAAFRSAEDAIIKELSSEKGKIIALGGGSFRGEHIDALKLNNVCVFINRSLDLLTPSRDCLVWNSKDKLAALLEKRLPLYQMSDLVVNNDSGIFEGSVAVLAKVKEFVYNFYA